MPLKLMTKSYLIKEQKLVTVNSAEQSNSEYFFRINGALWWTNDTTDVFECP